MKQQRFIAEWVLCGLWLLGSTALAESRAEGSGGADAAQVQKWLDTALSDNGEDPAAMLDLALRADAGLRKFSSPNPKMRAQACLAVALARHLAESPAAALKDLDGCFEVAVRSSSGALLLRIESLRAGLLWLNGDIDGAAAEYSGILSRNHSDSDTKTILRVQANYASVLSESGQTYAALDELQVVLSRGIEVGDTALLLAAGNNLIAIMIEQRMYATAAMWQRKILSYIDENSSPFFADALRLQGYQLIGLLGDPENQVRAIEKYLLANPDSLVVIRGSAEVLLTDAYRELGNLDASYEAGARAVALLQEMPIELQSARLSLAQTLVTQRRFSEVLRVLDMADTEELLQPNLEADIQELRVRATLSLENRDNVLPIFDSYVDAVRKQGTRQAEQGNRYFEAARVAREQEKRILDIESAQRELAVVARTRESEVQRERSVRNMWIVFFISLITVLALLAYLLWRWNLARRLSLQQKALNERLKKEVDEKSAALLKTSAEQAELERAMAEKAHTQAIGELTGNVAHDFNNLLQILSVSNEIVRGNNLTEAQVSVLNDSDTAIANGKNLVEQLLSFARRRDLQGEAIQLSRFLTHSQALFTAAVADRAELEIIDQSNGASVIVDPSSLTTTLLNLLSNAVDAIDGSGSIVLSVVYVAEQQVGSDWPELVGAGDYVQVSVEDNGCGMSADEVSRACDPFYSNKNTGQGSGLGLSSALGFARQSGGYLRIISKPSAFTRVEIALPVDSLQEDVVASREGEEPSARLDGLSVLLVEDNKTLVRMVAKMMTHVGATVEHVGSVDAALQRFESDWSFDIVLSDIRMIGVHDGYDLYKKVHSRWPDLPVLLMTGHDDRIDPDGEITVLHKPFAMDELIEAMKSEIDRMSACHSTPG